jgi:hypothetical protein
MSTSTSSENSIPSTDAAVRMRDASAPSALTRLHTTSRRLGGIFLTRGRQVGDVTPVHVQAARLDPVPMSCDA